MRGIIDTHVHFLDVARFEYPWLGREPAHRRSWTCDDYSRASDGCGIGRIVVVECDADASFGFEEAQWMHELARNEPRIVGVVARASFDGLRRLELERIASLPLVRGVRDNIQGHSSGYCLSDCFVQGVRATHERGLHFELCITHDQMREAIELVRLCPDGKFVLDHCGKPAIRDKLREPWTALLFELAAFNNVYCKISGLVTEADWQAWREDDVLEYAGVAARAFGPDRILFGSDWPLNELAGGYSRWLAATERLAAAWKASERERFFWRNAEHVYRLA